MSDEGAGPTPEPEDLDLEKLAAPPPASTGPRMLVPLFVVPLLIVAVVVGVFLGVSALIGRQESIEELIQRVESGGVNDRWQAAASLASKLRNDPDQVESPEVRARLRRALEVSPDVKVQEYLFKVTGSLRDRDSLPLVRKALKKMQATREANPDAFAGKEGEYLSRTFFAGIWCLGRCGDRESRVDLLALADDEDGAVRKVVALALGELFHATATQGGDVPEDVVAALKVLHGDSDDWVRMNAAIGLAQVGDATGLPTLETMLDRATLERHGLQFMDQGELTVSSHDPAFEPIVFALRSIRRLAEISPERDRMRVAGGPLESALVRFVEEESNPQLLQAGEELLGYLRGEIGEGDLP